MDTIGLQIQRQIGGSVNRNSNVLFDTQVNSYGDIVYNPVNGEIIINKVGRYFINWWVATLSAGASSNVTFTIQTSQGDSLIGNSPVRLGELVGFALLQVDSAPITISLVNTTTSSVNYSAVVPIRANLVLGEIPEEIGATPTMPTSVNRTYVANQGSDTVSVIDGFTNTVIYPP